MYISLSLDEILKYHQKIITKSGGFQGVKDIKLLDSALNRANIADETYILDWIKKHKQ